jgi:diguanylate cyclase (GGDEF)-like protein/PAS domain S-box-containing protein
VVDRRASFAAEQRGLARNLALIAAAACVIVAGLDITRLGVGVPAWWHTLILAVVNAAIAFACHRNVKSAPMFLPWVWGLSLPFIIVEPGITQLPDSSYLAVMLMAFATSGPRTLIVMGVLPLSILMSRAPSLAQSPYFESSFLTMHAGFILLFLLLQRAVLRAQLHAVRTESLAAAVAAASDDIVMVRELPVDKKQPRSRPMVRYLSGSLVRLLGYQPNDYENSIINMTEFIHPDDYQDCVAHERRLLKDGLKSSRVESRLRHRDGSWVWFEVRSVVSNEYFDTACIVSAMRDISTEHASREQQANEMAYQAQHDALTGLPNRWRLNRDLQRQMQPAGASLSLLFCDIDSFKHVNDSLGHDVGDELLCAFAARIKHLGDQHCQLYRFGGDEFVWLLSSASDKRAEDLAADLMHLTKEHLQIGDNRIVLTLSVGIAHASDAANADDLIRNADLAMYAAKSEGRNQFHVFDEPMKRQALRRHEVEQALRVALQNNELSLVYQPKVTMNDQRCVGVEALLRWTSQTLGVVGPTEFIPIAEETGIIIELGHFAMQRACEQMAPLCALYPIAVSVNVSMGQLADPERLLSSVASCLLQTGLAAHQLELEITESLFMKRPEQTVSTLKDLRALGVKISVDDFGTGYSSLAYLRRFPIDSLKIDRSFVQQMVGDSTSHVIVAAILSLAKQLGLRTIAEGVEQPAEMAALLALGCDQAQGYAVSKPLAFIDIGAYFEARLQVAEKFVPVGAEINS